MTIDGAAAAGLERRIVACSLCGTPWEEHLVEPGAPQEERLTLCASCLLATSHGHPLPE
jgi:hypothetical protein